jgi:release factor glutamine methyltransferase
MPEGSDISDIPFPPLQPTIATLVAEGEGVLTEAGIPAARLEAEVLLARRLGVERSAFLAQPEAAVGRAALEAYREDLERRAARYPLQYITGVQEFYSLTFEVDERVLIPRPETEMIIDEILRLASTVTAARDSRNRTAFLPDSPVSDPKTPRASGVAARHLQPLQEGGAPRLLVDVGTGSGCIAVAIARNLASCEVLAIDLSPEALEVARRNAARHEVEGRVRFALGDGLAPAREAGLEGRVDFVVSNPPYIAENELEGLQAELRHEPRLALSPGADGMSFTRTLIRDAAAVVKPRGWLLIELSAGRSAGAMRLLDPSLWEDAFVKPDLQGIPRLLMARRSVGSGTQA